jgi:hypothetical protein
MGMFGNVGEKSISQVYDERAAANLDPGTPLLEIFQLVPGPVLGVPTRMGFFGSNGAPNSAVIVGQYQDTTFRTDEVGTNFGEMINVKFIGASTADVSGTLGTGPMFGAGFAVGSIPNASGTLLCRFTEPNGTDVITQQATFRAVNLSAVDSLADISDLATGVTIQAAQLEDTQGNAADASWAEVSDGGSALSLGDQAGEQHIHDFHLIVSGSPDGAGRKIDFGYYVQLEYL